MLFLDSRNVAQHFTLHRRMEEGLSLRPQHLSWTEISLTTEPATQQQGKRSKLNKGASTSSCKRQGQGVEIKRKRFDMVNALPAEIIFAIFAKCDLKSLATASISQLEDVRFPFFNWISNNRQVHSQLQSSLAEDDSLWKAIYQCIYQNVVPESKNPNFNVKEKGRHDSWKELLKRFYQSPFESLKYISSATPNFFIR